MVVVEGVVGEPLIGALAAARAVDDHERRVVHRRVRRRLAHEGPGVAGPASPPTHTSATTIGFELDALPYITGGYYGSAWFGKNRVREPPCQPREFRLSFAQPEPGRRTCC